MFFVLLFVSARMEEERGASNAQILWSACQALARAVKSAPAGVAVGEVIRPLEPEIKAVTKAARKHSIYFLIIYVPSFDVNNSY